MDAFHFQFLSGELVGDAVNAACLWMGLKGDTPDARPPAFD
jgi:hypothetical protein